MLISSKLRDSKSHYEVHKEGLLILRKFRNKRVLINESQLRIVFSIGHEEDDLEKFNAAFLNLEESEQKENENSMQNVAELRISPYYKEISENRVLIFLNAFNKEETADLLIIGYLVASLFLYHQKAELSETCGLTKMLSELKTTLSDTEVHRLEIVFPFREEEVKFKSGCAKKPYFMCVFKENEKVRPNYHDYFREFYKYKEGNNLLNDSVDALIDFFPERSAVNIGNFRENVSQVIKLGNEYIKSILGRQIFNFEITGSTLENLCFEMCEVFNSKPTSIDLLKIYTKIINSQKMNVEDHSKEQYYSKAKSLENILPFENSQLIEDHCRIKEEVIKESMQEANNCMTFGEYLEIHSKLEGAMNQKIYEIENINKEMLRNRALACYDAVEDDEDMNLIISQLNEENVDTVFDAVSEKISMFIDESIFDSNTNELLKRLIAKYMERLSESVSENFTSLALAITQKTEKEINEKFHYEKKELEEKCKLLKNECVFLRSLNEEYKQKLLTAHPLISDTQTFEAISGTALNELKKKIIDLEIQLSERNQVIQGMGEVLGKFELEFQRKYFKPKFSQDVQGLLSEVSQKINNIHSLLNDLKKTEKFYEEIEVAFEKKKNMFNVERNHERELLNVTQGQLARILEEKRLLEVILEQARTTIEVMKNVEFENKQNINELENGCSNFKCLLAEKEGEFEQYKKALSLACAGKIDRLKDFYKVCDDEELKETIKPIFRK